VQSERDALQAEGDAVREERDALHTDLEAARQPSPADADFDKRLEAADARIRELELQLLGADRGERDKDVELSEMLEPPPPEPFTPTRSANRYNFSAKVPVEIDSTNGFLIDLSTGGAQVILPIELPRQKDVSVMLVSDEAPVAAKGTIAWTRIEHRGKGLPPHYRSGIAFTEVDEVAVETFIIRYAKG
jgi:hypothetical protein